MKIKSTSFFLILSPVLLIASPAYAGSSFETLSKSTSVIAIKNAEELNKIIEQLIEAKKSSQKALSKEEIEKIKEQAQEVLSRQAQKDEDAGAMVYTGCQILE